MIIIDLNTLRNIASRFDKKFAFNSQKSKMYKKAKFDSMFHFLSRVAYYENMINSFTNLPILVVCSFIRFVFYHLALCLVTSHNKYKNIYLSVILRFDNILLLLLNAVICYLSLPQLTFLEK